jgi:hypothetical protein
MNVATIRTSIARNAQRLVNNVQQHAERWQLKIQYSFLPEFMLIVLQRKVFLTKISKSSVVYFCAP